MFRRRFFANGRLVVLENTSHLVPAEKPREVAGAMRTFLEELKIAPRNGLPS
jgi:pimeloyl-ACP methyl ester carboxylesterase